jgi:hypothetical protein
MQAAESQIKGGLPGSLRLSERTRRERARRRSMKYESECYGQQQEAKLALVPVRPLDSTIPAPENDDIYRAISWNDPEIPELPGRSKRMYFSAVIPSWFCAVKRYAG